MSLYSNTETIEQKLYETMQEYADQQLLIQLVSQQRELLKTFCEYVDLESHAYPDDIKLDIENHIKVFNSP